MKKLQKLIAKAALGGKYKSFDAVQNSKFELILTLLAITFLASLLALFKVAVASGFNVWLLISVMLMHAAFIPLRFLNGTKSYVGLMLVIYELLMFVNHVALGGFAGGSGILLWALPPLVGLVVLYPKKLSVNAACTFSVLAAAFYIFEVNAIVAPDAPTVVTLHEINFPGLLFCAIITTREYALALNLERQARRGLHDMFVAQHNRAELAKAELEEKNAALREAIESIKTAQSKIVQQEKMILLGQLIAGVAHEINTPVGAIRASSGYIYDTMVAGFAEIIVKIKSLDDEHIEAFVTMVELAHDLPNSLSSAERRQARREFRTYLEENGAENADLLAGLLVDMELTFEIGGGFIKAAARLSELSKVLELSYTFTTVLRSVSNVSIATERISKIVYALKSYSHVDYTGTMLLVDIAEAIDTVLVLYQSQIKRGIEIVKNYLPVPQILCYPDELNQAWSNIIFNAIQAMDGTGALTISIYKNEKKDGVCISFKDTGPGIPEEIAEKIFEPFFTTKAMGEGSGLGLDITKRVIEKHNGTIKIVSAPGEGANFIVTLPDGE